LLTILFFFLKKNKNKNKTNSAKDAGITVMNEIGLDPGIDHLYAVKTIEEVHKEGGKVRLSITLNIT
jgi:saccharopine dehydrogenase-like NADP-dependent oxidoreductase